MYEFHLVSLFKKKKNPEEMKLKASFQKTVQNSCNKTFKVIR